MSDVPLPKAVTIRAERSRWEDIRLLIDEHLDHDVQVTFRDLTACDRQYLPQRVIFGSRPKLPRATLQKLDVHFASKGLSSYADTGYADTGGE